MIIPENKKEILKNIRLIALDLDRTLLTSHGLGQWTKETLEEAIRRGIQVVVATGRPLVALPKSIWTVDGLRYTICSNGAQIVDLRDGSLLYSDYIDPEVSEWLRLHLLNLGYPIEVFSEGGAFISSERYQFFVDNANTPEGSEYVLTTRKPVDDIWEFWKQHIDTIENINIIIKDPERKQEIWKE
ncbi:MAG: HAD hydrolase family protein, partial [Firmicutes bacterium]|nr:HAD hydrolase family protein [Bacillota bacterium]